MPLLLSFFAALQAVELRPPVVENGDAGAEGRDGGKAQVGGDDLLFPAALGSDLSLIHI